MTAARLVPVLVLLALAAMVGAGVWLLSETPGTLVNEDAPLLGPTREPAGEVIVVTVTEGDSAEEIGDKLEDAGVVESARLFRVLASLLGVSDDMSAGDYEFESTVTALTAVQRISQGVTASRVVTIREGLRSEEIGDLLEERGVVASADLRAALSQDYSASFLASEPAGGLEGFLFPATYGFSRSVTAHEAVQQMLDAFDQRYREEIRALLPQTSLSLREAVTLASIVEREAGVPEERATIASVFLNRLALGLPLQADPTVQYAVGNDPANVAQFGYWKEELSLADLALPSPYNTYVNVGLPPGPIANPGLDSILGVLRPAETNFLFFVARPDGTHAFAETLEEHRQNVCALDPSRPEC
jgi:UPF0755 protein